MNFYKKLELILTQTQLATKIESFKEFYEEYKNGAFDEELGLQTQHIPKEFVSPSYASICEIVPPQDVQKRSNLTTTQGQIYLVHAIAHIEYSAIDLALDSAYRFHSMPKAYYDDWLEVASDEIRHFCALEEILQSLGSHYGAVSVHNALFEALQKTQTLLERMAVVPRYLEANGLDATPLILEKLKKLPKNEMLERIIAALEMILSEEISHVKKGDFWFGYACEAQHLSKDVYFQIIEKHYPQGFLRAKNLNINARVEAGFSCKELGFMAKKELC